MNIKQIALNPCPCGKTPTKLCLCDAGQGGKWANVSGDCCNEWTLEFRTEYNALDSEKCIELATERWNEATNALIGDSEPVCYTWNDDGVDKYTNDKDYVEALVEALHKRITVIPLFTKPPSLIAKEAECERLRELLAESANTIANNVGECERLRKALEGLVKDLKMRADNLKQEDAQGVVACGNGVWIRACEALKGE
jgi:hypothetical protein